MRPFIALLVILAAAAAGAAVTIGPGPALGTDLAGWTWYEEFQDWTRQDVRAIDQADDGYAFNDGYDESRDLIAFYQRYEGDDLRLRVDFLDLRAGWQGNLNLYVAIRCAAGGAEWLPDFLDVRTDNPWNICLALYADGDVGGSTYNVYDSGYGNGWNGWFGGSYWNTELDAVEMTIPFALLTAAGWDGDFPLHFQVVTAKDYTETSCSNGETSSDLADAFADDDRGCSDGELNGAVRSDDLGGCVWYASIAHGNQSLNRAGDLRVHVYDPESNTGIPGGTGFVRTLETHRLFDVPLNIHASGTLLAGLQWAPSPYGPTDPADGPGLLAEIGRFADADQTDRPGALIGGVLAEHILPYFEGPANAASFAAADTLHRALFDLGPADLRVMHVPERVIRSLPTGLAPLDGLTFADIGAAGYDVTYLDAAAHLHHWFYPAETAWPDPSYRHKAHRINGVLCWMINHREDDKKFWVQDGGLHLDTRRSLIGKAAVWDPQLVLVFDDWEALAGKSFGAVSGEMEPNDNPNQYHRTIRWLANHPWVVMTTLRDHSAEAEALPEFWVIDHGTRTDLEVQTYHWLQHACEDSYHNWYYNNAGGVTGNEQSFYDLVPVISGEQGDYRARGVGPEADGPSIPSGAPFGDLNTPGTLLHDAWAAVAAAPPGGLRFLAEASFSAMIYETAWHEEDATDYADSDGFGDWLYPDASWDGLSGWALRLHNHARDVAALAVAAAWADSVRTGLLAGSAPTHAWFQDTDLDGAGEVVLRNGKVWTVWQEHGGRCLLAARFDPVRDDAVLLLGNPLANPSAPGEEEFADARATRCSGFKIMNGGYADAVFALMPAGASLTTVSADGLVTLAHTLPAGSDTLTTAVSESVSGPLYVRSGWSPDLQRLFAGGPDLLTRTYDGPSPELSSSYRLSVGDVGLTALFDAAVFVASPLHSGFERRDLALTEEVELSGEGSFSFRTVFGGINDLTAVSEGTPPSAPALGALRAAPNPFNPSTEITFELRRDARVTAAVYDAAGRRVRVLADAEARAAGAHTLVWRGRDDANRPVSAGVYLVRVEAAGIIRMGSVTLVK
jgi:hypothetical protein